MNHSAKKMKEKVCLQLKYGFKPEPNTHTHTHTHTHTQTHAHFCNTFDFHSCIVRITPSKNLEFIITAINFPPCINWNFYNPTNSLDCAQKKSSGSCNNFPSKHNLRGRWPPRCTGHTTLTRNNVETVTPDAQRVVLPSCVTLGVAKEHAPLARNNISEPNQNELCL